jgi:Luciferase-like monooxygenase
MTSTAPPPGQSGRVRHPVLGDWALKLGTFSANLSGGCAVSTAEGVLEAERPQTAELGRLGDAMEFEALAPVGRWRGFGGPADFNGAGLECCTWAAGQAAQAAQAGIFAASHVPTIHPVMAAKQATTVDHISGGRFAPNIVTGWNKPEIEMFGAPLLPHDERHDVAQEWVDIVVRLWAWDEPYSFEGKYYKAYILQEDAEAEAPVPGLLGQHDRLDGLVQRRDHQRDEVPLHRRLGRLPHRRLHGPGRRLPRCHVGDRPRRGPAVVAALHPGHALGSSRKPTRFW